MMIDDKIALTWIDNILNSLLEVDQLAILVVDVIETSGRVQETTNVEKMQKLAQKLDEKLLARSMKTTAC